MKLLICPVPRTGFYIIWFVLSALVLSNCTLLYPHRIPNPKTPAEFKARQKAARQAQKDVARAARNEAKSSRKKKEQETDDSAGAAPSADPAAAGAAAVGGQGASMLDNKSTVKYDKKGLMKKPKMKRLRYYKNQTKPARKPFRPLRFVRSLFRKKPKRHDKTKTQPVPAKSEPAPTPTPVDTGLTP